MSARMKNPAMLLPDATQAIQALLASTQSAGVPPATLNLTHLRASQINGCSSCVDAGSCQAKRSGESDERLFAVAAWKDTSYFTEAERAALALTEAVTRLDGGPDSVSDELWEEVAKHYDEVGIAALLMSIATTNFFNRLNVPVRQVAGAW